MNIDTISKSPVVRGRAMSKGHVRAWSPCTPPEIANAV